MNLKQLIVNTIVIALFIYSFNSHKAVSIKVKQYNGLLMQYNDLTIKQQNTETQLAMSDKLNFECDARTNILNKEISVLRIKHKTGLFSRLFGKNS